MCGIAGLVLPGVTVDLARQGLVAMCAAMAHRGPDDQGLVCEPLGRHTSFAIGLGMRRLSIIDTRGGHQPISNEDGSVVVVFNGEIYNHNELRTRLKAQGHRFSTHTDTEVLVHLYEEKGVDLASELVGMFAFALYDRAKQKMILARDRLGIKPLYLLEKDGNLLFSSEIKSLLAAQQVWPGGWHPQLSPDAMESMLTLMYVPSPQSIYKGIRQLPAGHIATIDLRHGAAREEAYWSLPQTSSPFQSTTSYDEAYEMLKELFAQSIQEHLLSDVPVGAFVSGGVDSGLVASYAAEHYPKQLQTFSIGFTEAAYDETQDALRLIQQLQTPHTIQYGTYDTLYSALPTIFRMMDQPFGDSSMLPTWLASQLASSKLKVVLSGDGGDEVFAGYTKHLIEFYKSRLSALPKPVVNRLQKVLTHLPKDRGSRLTNLIRKAEKASRSLHHDSRHSYLQMLKLADSAYISSLLQAPVGTASIDNLVDQIWSTAPDDTTNLQRTQWADTQLPLVDDMLVKVDRMSMLCSLEVRVPFLDHRIVEFGYHLPDNYKLEGREGKRILKRLFCERYGIERYTKPKQGFGVPIEEWFESRLQPLIQYLFSESRLENQGLFRADTIGGKRAMNVARQAPFVFWNVLMVQVWHELQIEKRDDLFDYL